MHRPVWLYATGAAHVADLNADHRPGRRRRLAVLSGRGPRRARHAGADRPAGRRRCRGRRTVPGVHRWAPGDGYLYDLEVRLVDGSGEVVDDYRQPVGFRTVAVDGIRFLINGEAFHFTGFGMHEDHAVIGKAHDDAHMLHDIAVLRWAGANSFRTSHYPYSQDVLEYADRHGLVVIDEVAAVGLNMSPPER
ncbi:glycoside hydrolase family 2 TIM barrel-domain containing protein [Dactylosporangium sp. NPDC000521]|uniref:glycoside hydrolase family 2 TIM barrel-domain containing protein n=1 Tax=Dactylosporangium sp. NPDC000521 TaxID=3363975 RepID=UPI003690FF9E